MLKNVISDVLKQVLNSAFAGNQTRWAYNFDGVDDRGVLAFRAINPDGDIDIEWEQLGVNNTGPTPRCIVTQSISTTISEREFVLRWDGNSGQLNFLVGGSVIAPSGLQCTDGKWRATIVGNQVTITLNGNIVGTRTVTRGAAREPTATTSIGVRNSNGTFPENMLGIIYNIKINGVLYPIADKDQSIQLPLPTGLGAELITQSVLENPSSVGSGWTYLGGGRWQYDGDGSFSPLLFVSTAEQGEALFAEFEVESISGNMRCFSTTANVGTNQSDPQFSKPGKYRWYVLNRTLTSSTATFQFQRQNTGVAASCIIKNISFKPLGTANPLVLTNTTPDRWVEVLK